MDIEDLLLLASKFPPKDKRVHYSVLLHRDRIVGFGMENRAKTHPLAAKKGYKYPTIHSELAAFMDLSDSVDPSRCTLVNFRVSPTGNIGMSRPCKYCIGWCCETFNEIWYTDQNGELVRYDKNAN